MKKIITFHPNPDYKSYVGLQSGYDKQLYTKCNHKGPKSIVYQYDPILSVKGNAKRMKNYYYTFQVCRKCFEKNHEQWMKGIDLPLKYPENEALHFWEDSNIKSTSNLK